MSGNNVVSTMRRVLQSPRLRRIAQWVIVLVALGYVANSVVANWGALSEYRQQFDARYLLAALVCIMAARCLVGLASREAFSGLGFSLNARTVFRGYHLAALSLYMPGGLYIGRPVIFGQHGVDPVSTSAGVLIEQSAMTLIELLASVPYLLIVGLGSWSRYWGLGLLIVLPMLVFVHPAVMNPVLRWLLGRLGYRHRTVNLTVRQLFRMLLFDSASVLVSGLSSYLLVSSVYRPPLRLLPLLGSAHSLSMLVSTVIALTPASLGIHEGVSTLLTSPLLPPAVPALVSILGRLVSTAALLILFGIAALMGETPRQRRAAVSGSPSEE